MHVTSAAAGCSWLIEIGTATCPWPAALAVTSCASTSINTQQHTHWNTHIHATPQARFLADHPQPLGLLGLAAVLAVQGTGYYIFRGANGQKDAFRRDPSHPSVAHLQSMATARGTRLITSGWWGAARHINYLGDWLMGLAWCMPCGLAGAASVVPYFYCLYFASLLVHRERRDEAACRAKYGADWERYCALVPWRIVPKVY